MTKFKEFKLGAIMTPQTTQAYSVSKNRLISTDGAVPVIASGTNNIGISGFSNYEANNKCGVITYSDATGDSDTFFYRDVDFIGYSHTKQLVPKDFILTSRLSQYLITCIKKAIQGQYSWANKLNNDAISSTLIVLPVDDNDEPDWDYMDKYIQEIQAKYLREKKAECDHRVATFDDVIGDDKLDEQECQAVLDRYQKAQFGKFRIGDLFDIDTGTRIDPVKLLPGNVERITVKNTDNGIYGKYSTDTMSEVTHFTNFISINFFGHAYYHAEKASVEMKVHVLHLKHRDFTKNVGLYITTALNKLLKDKFGYGNQLSSSKLRTKDFEITLPVNLHGTPDYELMHDFINLIQTKYVLNLNSQLQSRIDLAKTLI